MCEPCEKVTAGLTKSNGSLLPGLWLILSGLWLIQRWADCLEIRVSYTFISTRIYKPLAAARRILEPKQAENSRLRFASSAHLLQQTEQKAKIMAERWRQMSKHLVTKK